MSTILTCTDGSLYAPSVYQYSEWAAARLGAVIHVLHVIEREEFPATHDLSGNLGFAASHELLEELTRFDEAHSRIARMRGTAILEDAAIQIAAQTISTQRHGSLVDAVAEFEKDADLIVIGKRGEHADFSKGHLGSNLERIVRSANIPVLVAARQWKPVKRFLIAFDNGTSALEALHYLGTQQLLKGADCNLVAVGKPDSELARSIETASIALVAAGYHVTSELLPGDADEIILEKVKETSADLIVMGAYGHSRIRELLLGSTTTNILRNCQVPVLLFR